MPRFQTVGRTRPPEASESAASLLKQALAALSADEEAKPDVNRVALLGHSAGAGVAANLAAAARTEGLPVPKLIYAVMPGGIASDAKSRGILLSDLSQIDPSTLIVTVVGDREFQASDRLSRRILREASAVPPQRKLFIRTLSDDHGFPALSATLASPGSTKPGYDAAAIKVDPDPPRDPKEKVVRPKWSADMVLSGEQTVLVAQLGTNVTDTLDYLGFWKTFDMAAEAAFAGRDAQALRNDSSLSDMGRWSDGWPVKRMAAEIPRAPSEGATPVARSAPAPSLLPVPSKRRH
jgi:dienelactone hydrolase